MFLKYVVAQRLVFSGRLWIAGEWLVFRILVFRLLAFEGRTRRYEVVLFIIASPVVLSGSSPRKEESKRVEQQTGATNRDSSYVGMTKFINCFVIPRNEVSPQVEQ
jgi:hypothetical protein